MIDLSAKPTSFHQSGQEWRRPGLVREFTPKYGPCSNDGVQTDVVHRDEWAKTESKLQGGPIDLHRKDPISPQFHGSYEHRVEKTIHQKTDFIADHKGQFAKLLPFLLIHLQ